jgi:hypothetical protein
MQKAVFDRRKRDFRTAKRASPRALFGAFALPTDHFFPLPQLILEPVRRPTFQPLVEIH